MKINVSLIKKEIGSRQPFSFTYDSAELFTEEKERWTNGVIHVEGSVVNNGRLLEINGAVNVKAKLNCDRCLDEYTAELTIPFHDYFADEAAAPDRSEGDFLLFSGDEIDIFDLIRETIVLSEPLQKRCSEACKGLCASCGANLNTSTCGCVNQSIDPRLAALKQLLEKE